MKLYHLSSRARATLMLGVASCLLSCARVLGIEETQLDEGPAPSEDWSCVGKTKSDNDQTITIHVMAREFLSADVEPKKVKVNVRTCSWLLADCGKEAIKTTNDDGEIDIDIKDNPYLEFTAEGYKTMLWFFSRKPSKSFNMTVLMLSEQNWTAMTSNLGVPVNAELGHLTFSAYTCASTIDAPVMAKGVEVDTDTRNEESKRFYAVGQSFLADTKQTTTTESGRGAIFNLAPGSVSVSVKHASNTVISTAPVPIRKNAISTIDLYPL